MKIGEFSDSFIPVVDGVGRVVFNYCNAIGKKGIECTAVVPMDKFDYLGQYPFEVIDFYSATLPKLNQYKAGMPTFDPHYHARLNMKEFDIVHVHTPFIAGVEGLLYAKKHNIPVIGTFHSKYYDDFYQITGIRPLAQLGTKGIVDFFEACDEVWAVSNSSAETLKSYGYSKEVFVIDNGMAIREIDEDAAEKAKEFYGLDEKPILLFVGQMNWKKNILRIIEACSLLKKDGVEFNLVMAGQGPHKDEILNKVEELGLMDNFKYVGHITDEKHLDGLYAAASLFVFPSIYDNAPMVVREAANALTPSVLVKGSSAAERVIDKYNGLLCEDNSESLYEVLKDGLGNEALLQRMGLEARRTILVGWDQVIERVLDRYEYIINKHKEEHQK